jgi:hypothetical protein
MKAQISHLLTTLALCTGLHQAIAQGTAFTYQGQLQNNGSPANGNYDLQFSLFDASTNGNPVGAVITNLAVGVTNGLFTTTMDFGPGIFTGNALWLQIGVETNGGGGDFTILGALQPLTSTPYAIYSANSASATTAIGVANGSVTSASIASGQVVKSLNGLTDFVTLSAGTNITLTPSGNTLTISSTVSNSSGTCSSNEWSLMGNAGTTAGLNFLGTTDNQPLEFRVNGLRALRLEPGNGQPNVIGGAANNAVTGGTTGATIAGGYANTNSGNYATIGGGYMNEATGPGSFVGGGGYDGYSFHPNTASGPASMVGGGINNQASSTYATVGGGGENTADNEWATVSGGGGNTAGNVLATVGGGSDNIAGGYISTVGGGSGNTASGSSSTIPGGSGNTAAGTGSFAAGQNAHANNNGSFVWGDGSANVNDNAPNEFQVLATGGVGLYTGTNNVNIVSSGKMTFGSNTRQMIDLYNASGFDYGIGVQTATLYMRAGNNGGFAWYSGGSHNDGQDNSGGGTTLMTLAGVTGNLVVKGTVTQNSDRSMKANIIAVDPRTILDQLAAIPMMKWTYKAEAPSTRHLGPMAQDFYAAFNLGEDDKHITTVDEGGVALAAIQGLNQKVEEKDAEIQELKQSVADLKKMVQSLAAKK